MTRKRFQELVAEAMRHIPPDLCEAMENVAVIVEDRPSDEILAELEISPPDTLYGLYQGIPLTEREWGHVADLPDRITIFREPILEDAEDEDDVVRAVGETIIHEFGHHFGLSEEEIEETEAIWRDGLADDEEV